MPISRVKLENFTAFSELDFKPSPGINVLVGENGTGKTHLMKVMYAACAVSKNEQHFGEKLTRVFMPSGWAPGRLVRRKRGSSECRATVYNEKKNLSVQFSSHLKSLDSPKGFKTRGRENWCSGKIQSAYIPAKEVLSNARGFRSLYEERQIHFEETYQDIIRLACLPPLRDSKIQEQKNLLKRIQGVLGGTVYATGFDEFFLKCPGGDLEFSLLAEGLRKLGLLWVLIQNGILRKGSVLFWDEPEANLNPGLFEVLIGVLLELQRQGVQIFLATHDYVILKELDLSRKPDDKISFHSLYRDKKEKRIKLHSTEQYLDIHSSAIDDAFASLYDRDIKRSCGGS